MRQRGAWWHTSLGNHTITCRRRPPQHVPHIHAPPPPCLAACLPPTAYCLLPTAYCRRYLVWLAAAASECCCYGRLWSSANSWASPPPARWRWRGGLALHCPAAAACSVLLPAGRCLLRCCLGCVCCRYGTVPTRPCRSLRFATLCNVLLRIVIVLAAARWGFSRQLLCSHADMNIRCPHNSSTS